MEDSKLSKAWSTTKIILSWFFGILFIFSGIGSITGGVLITGLLFLGLGAYLIPPLHQKLPSQITDWVGQRRKNVAYSFVVVIVLGAVVDSYNIQEKEKEAAAIAQAEAQAAANEKLKNEYLAQRDQMLADMKEKLEAKDYKGVMALAGPWNRINDESMTPYTSVAQAELKKIADIETEKRLNEQLKELTPTPDTELENVIKKYQTLISIRPDNEKYKEGLAKTQKRLKEYKAELVAEEARKKKIEEQFSAWDGSHRGLERVIKRAMNDPDSYEHDETVYWDRGDHLIVRTTYRGRNAFGGMVRNFVKAKVSLEGDVLAIIDQT